MNTERAGKEVLLPILVSSQIKWLVYIYIYIFEITYQLILRIPIKEAKGEDIF